MEFCIALLIEVENIWVAKSETVKHIKPRAGGLQNILRFELPFNHVVFRATCIRCPDREKRNYNLECQFLEMPPCIILCCTLLFITLLKADQSQLDGSRGLKRRVNVRGGIRVSYGHFAVDKFHRLHVSVGSSTLVSNYTECALSCVNTPLCSSFNVASSPRLDEKYRCELLDKDKYSANPGQLVSSQEYHHYSIKVLRKSYCMILFNIKSVSSKSML